MDTNIPKIDEEGILLCPGCGSRFLHHQRVATYWREEDSKEVHGVVDTLGETSEVVDSQLNPSPRRSGMRIAFHCETCFCESTLSMWQHKGSTHVEFDSIREIGRDDPNFLRVE